MKALARIIGLAAFREKNPKAVDRQPTKAARMHGARLARRWLRDPQSGRLVCVWRSDDDGDPGGRLRFLPFAA